MLLHWLIIAFRFYRNLFTGEGYLSWTLPASGIQHLWAKIISGCIWYLLNCFIEAGCVLFLVSGSTVTEAYSHIAPEVTAELGIPLSTFALVLFLLMLVSGPVSVIQTYFCVVIGQLFPAHRILGAVAAYFVSSFVIQILSFVLQMETGLLPEAFFIAQTGIGYAVRDLFLRYNRILLHNDVHHRDHSVLRDPLHHEGENQSAVTSVIIIN